MAFHNDIGKYGEDIAAKYLDNKGFFVIERNYRKKWGEIDIIATKDNLLHFIEVKTVSRALNNNFPENQKNNYRPEDNMHPWKLKRLGRAIQTYLLERYKEGDPEWQFDLICVYLDMTRKIAKVRYSSNIIL